MTKKIFLENLQGNKTAHPPIWLMRQAGRYLPEYWEIRNEAKTFLNLCYNPEWACEVTMQPIRRFGFDAAILFSDILVAPDALGQKVSFVQGEGPRLDPLDENSIAKLNYDKAGATYDIIAETVSLLSTSLPKETALIGFCGAPWTVATYMIAGKGTKDQAPTRLFAYQHPKAFETLIDLLVETSFDYLSRQINAGAEAIQIFDSWAGVLPEGEFMRWVIAPTKRLVGKLKTAFPHIPIIGFPRGAGFFYETYIRETGVQGVSCDQTLPIDYIKTKLQPNVCVQGNLDQLLLVAGGAALETQILKIKSELSGGPFIFNLGHGILPTTPIRNVEKLIELVRS